MKSSSLSKAFSIYSRKQWAWESSSLIGCWGCVIDGLQLHPLVPSPCWCWAHTSWGCVQSMTEHSWVPSRALQARYGAPQLGSELEDLSLNSLKYYENCTAAQDLSPLLSCPSQGSDMHVHLMAPPDGRTSLFSYLHVFPHRYFTQQISYFCSHLGIHFSQNPD